MCETRISIICETLWILQNLSFEPESLSKINSYGPTPSFFAKVTQGLILEHFLDQSGAHIDKPLQLSDQKLKLLEELLWFTANIIADNPT